MLDGDLILVDAGAEWEYYASDISRTFPVNGRFSPAQKTLYNHLLDVQKKIINMIRPGISFKIIQNKTCELLFESLKTEGILQSNSKLEDVREFFPHNFGHLLGLDVHDVHCFKKDRGSDRLRAGMVLTVEPGLYIQEDPLYRRSFKVLAFVSRIMFLSLKSGSGKSFSRIFQKK